MDRIRRLSPQKEPGPPPEVAVDEIDRCINKPLHDKSISAAACVASVGDSIFHRRVYGSPVMPPPPRPIGHDALFDLASLTKPLGTALGALFLAGKGRINLQSTVRQVLRDLKDDRFDAITLEMLLDHTGGFAPTAPLWEPVRSEDRRRHPKDRLLGTRKAVPDIRKLLATTPPLEADPGQKAIYSDLGFVVLAWAIEKVVGRPLDVFLEQEIYRPLGIERDLFFVRLDDPKARKKLAARTFVATERCPWRDKLLQGEVHDPLAWAMGGVAGHAGLFGTADAVWRIAKELWEAHQGRGDRILFHGPTLQRFWTRSKRVPQTTRTLGGWDTPSAHGSHAGKRFSRGSVGHLGFTGTSVWIDPAKDFIAVLLTNAVHPSAEGKREVLAKLRPRVHDRIASGGAAHRAAVGGCERGSRSFGR